MPRRRKLTFPPGTHLTHSRRSLPGSMKECGKFTEEPTCTHNPLTTHDVRHNPENPNVSPTARREKQSTVIITFSPTHLAASSTCATRTLRQRFPSLDVLPISSASSNWGRFSGLSVIFGGQGVFSALAALHLLL